MITRGTRSMSMGDVTTGGESPVPNPHDITVVHPIPHSSPLGIPSVSARMPEFYGMPEASLHNTVVASPQAVSYHSVEKAEGGQPGTELTVKDLEMIRKDLSLQARELELGRRELEFERVQMRNQQRGDTERERREPSTGASLPRIEIPSFDGSPLKYWSFKRSFDTNIASRVRDKAQRFSYLQYYCRGEASVVIDGCAILDADTAYLEAWRLLEKQFGGPHRLVHAMLHEILEGGQVGEDLISIQALARKMRKCLISLTQMGRVRDLDVSANLLILSNRLPQRLQDKWAKRAGQLIDDGEEPAFADLLDLVEKRISAMDNLYGMSISKREKAPHPRQQMTQHQSSRVSAVVASKFPPCAWCQDESHGLGGCRRFAEATMQTRREFIWRNKRCFICLSSTHLVNDCRSTARCAIDKCGGKHHPLLHLQVPSKEAVSRINSNVATGRVRLGFISVVIKGPEFEVVTNALIDNGSDVTLISKKIARLLKLDGVTCTLNIRTLHGTQPTSSERVTVNVSSIDGEFAAQATNVFTVDRLPCSRVDQPMDLAQWPHLTDVSIESISHDEVGMLIGCDLPEAHWVMDQRIGNTDEPHAVLTPFGWTVRGNTGGSRLQTSRVNCMTVEALTPEECLEEMYEKEFKWSNDGESEAPSKEDERALAIVERTTALVDGRYEVGVPWRRDDTQLPNNHSMALRRASFLRKRLLRDGELLAKYQATMGTYVKKGYVSMVGGERELRRWYLPHHPVVNPRKPSKVRIVFDCAAKFVNRSLNDELLSGPNLNNDLAGVLVRFREGPVAAAADIEEMFLRVRLPTRDRWAFSFLWWTNDQLLGEPRVFQWNVHPFGATSSPFCAAYALRKAAGTSDLNEPCLKAVVDNFYVDDCLLASASIETATTVAKQLMDMLGHVGFRLTKWASNIPESLSQIPEEDRLAVADCKDLVDKGSHSTLGLLWDIRRDTLGVNLSVSSKPVTRRGVLATVASFFDPLGIVSPLLLPARNFLQRLCHQGLGWDSKLEVVDSKWWVDWLSKMTDTPTIEVPRYHIQSATAPGSSELHVFSDASETGYGAVAYLRSEEVNGKVHCHFLMGKSRVVPRKPITVPRLELTAAVLAIKLLKFIRTESRMEFMAAFVWTDSEIVLHYLRNTASRFKTFVANRVAYILENSKMDQWRHVPTANNPADLASRGTTKGTSAEIDLWLNGPAFLRLGVAEWPQTRLEGKDMNADEEVKRVAAISVDDERHPVLSKLLLRYSTWTGLLRGAAWLRRFVRYIVVMRVGRPGDGLKVGNLELCELNEAEICLVTMIQKDGFEGELLALELSPSRKIKTSIARLKPEEHDGLLCMGGRVSKRLILLPHRHPAVDILIRHYHERCGHMGATHVLANIRSKFWIVKGMAAVRRVLSGCLKCRAATAKPCGQMMSSLPPLRINEGSSPFLECGLDYFGPFEIKRGRTVRKRYGCIFTCMKTRAVHLEVAHSMTTDSFLMALIRFVGRRGTPENIYSDNGTNFVGAEAELRRQLGDLDQSRISRTMTARGIVWHFNPPGASHRGGAWERMIRTTRRVLSSVTSGQTLTDESFMTFMVEVERLINDRPIAPIYDDPEEPLALRPNDLLLLRSNPGIVSSEVDMLERYTKAWRQAQYLASVFWKRWVREYLPTLQISNRWTTTRRDVAVGDLVLLIGGSRVYGSWPKGVITETTAGRDEHVRDVTVRTSTGLVKRDIRSVSLLEAAIDVAN